MRVSYFSSSLPFAQAHRALCVFAATVISFSQKCKAFIKLESRRIVILCIASITLPTLGRHRGLPLLWLATPQLTKDRARFLA
jgi:hypothetical protein